MILHSRWMAPVAAGLVLWMIIMFGVISGAAAGYEADNLEETQIEFDGEYIHTSDGESEKIGIDWDDENELQSVQPWYVDLTEGHIPNIEQTSVGEEVEKRYQAMADQLLWASIWLVVATWNISGVFFYFLSPIIPLSVTRLALQVISYLPILAVLYLVAHQYNQTIREVIGA